MSLNIPQLIEQIRQDNGQTKVWIADKADINYKTFVDKMKRDTFTGYELLKIAKVLNINLEELKKEI